MTMPHLQNCSHSKDGWCLNCVKELWEYHNNPFLGKSAQEIENEIRAIYTYIPNYVTVHQGGGPEDIFASLAVSVARLRGENLILEDKIEKLEKELEELRESYQDCCYDRDWD